MPDRTYESSLEGKPCVGAWPSRPRPQLSQPFMFSARRPILKMEETGGSAFPRSGSSPALSGEEGYLRLPWFSIYYDGRHLYKVFAVDGNWFDLVRSIPEGGGGIGFGGNLGDGVDPPIWHINGGIGLFGSAAVDSLGFFIAPLVQDP